MKSQSTIIGRVTPDFVYIYKKEIAYWLRYHSQLLQYAIGVGLTAALAVVLITSMVQQHHADVLAAAKNAHYAVGQTILCDLSDETTTEDDGWHNCKVDSISKDKTHYQVEFQSPSAHRIITYNFSVMDVGKK